MAFIARFEQEVLFHTSSVLTHEGIVHGFSTRIGGVSTGVFASMNLRLGGSFVDDRDSVRENYRRFCSAVGADATRLVPAKQVHEDTVRMVTHDDVCVDLFDSCNHPADALITNEPGLSLMVFSADCGIFLLHDRESGCVGAVHAGWRGTALGLPAKAVSEMVKRFGANPGSIRAALGAGIGPCCFETDEDVPQAMVNAFGSDAWAYCRKRGEKWMVDLRGINLWQLREAGISGEHLDSLERCTACESDLYWSNRVMGEKRGVQAALIALKGADCT